MTLLRQPPGAMRSRYSTTSTCAPKRRQIDPISSPMLPAPITRSRRGGSRSESAPVKSTILL